MDEAGLRRAGRLPHRPASRASRPRADRPPRRAGPAGETGEIIVSLASDEAFSGYYNRPDATARAIREGWYFTGDTGYLDEDGDLWVTGRVDDMIITGGENVYPVEVEDALARHPGVAEVAVVGLPDERWGQVVTAFIVPRSSQPPPAHPELVEGPDPPSSADGEPVEPRASEQPLTTAEIDAYCRSNASLASFKRPRKIIFVKQIPKSPVGKILRRLLIAGEYEPLEPATIGSSTLP